MIVRGVKTFKVTEVNDKSVEISLKCESQAVAASLYEKINQMAKEGKFSLSFDVDKL